MVVIVGLLIPSSIATVLILNLQPKCGIAGPPCPSAPQGGPSGGGAVGGGGTVKTSVVEVDMPNGVNFNKKLNFDPPTLVVVVGINNTIEWVNKDSADHTVTFTSVPSGVQAQSISGADVPPGDRFGPITLTVPGVYQYHCTFHPFWMIGKIIVVASK